MTEPTKPGPSADRRSVEPAAEGRFRVIAELGEGGMARVHLAVARGPSGFNKLVVLKALRPNLARDPECLEMFLHEARLGARLNHPNVVQTYEVTEDGGRHVMVMEYLEGQPLSQILVRARKSEALPLAMHLRILCDTLAGLHYAHELRDFDDTPLHLVHRDVSPQNVFVSFDGQVKILDFGIAKATIAAPTETETGVLKGKVRYMSPEQMASDPVDRRADIFAVGAMLWEALTGEKIWSGVTDMVVMQRVMAGAITPPKQVRPDVPDRLQQICLKAMACSPSDRYATANDMETALEDVLIEMGMHVKPRDVGQLVARLFADTRAEIKAVIEQQMNRAVELTSSEFETVTPVPLYGMTHTTTTGTSKGVGPGAASPEARRGRWVAALLVLLGFVSVLVVLVWLGLHRTPEPRPDVASVVPTKTASVTAPLAPPPEASRPQAPVTIDLSIAATPAQARLFFDDRPLPSNPYVHTYPRDGSSHRVRAEALGYLPQTLDVTLDKSDTVAIALAAAPATGTFPARPVHSAGTTVVPTAVPPPPVTTASTPAKPNCAQPYYVDDQGIKKIRSECL